MTPNELRDLLIMTAGILLSLAFSYVPKMNTWYARLDGTQKRLLMLGLLLLATLGMFGITCTDLIVIPSLACDRQTAIQLLQAFVWAAIANQTTYQLSPQSAKAKG